jgi:hypothetical protein
MPSNAFLVFFVPWWFIFCHIGVNKPGERMKGRTLMEATKRLTAVGLLLAMALVATGCAGRKGHPGPGVFETKDIAESAYIYGFPMIGNYKALYEFTIDKNSGQYKAPFNQVASDARVFTPKDTTVITPNSDTPYSLLEMDLRAEPLVLCVPEVEKGRYYSVQLVDMYTFNVGYIGSRATGNGAGCYMVAGPGWKGATPAGVAKVFSFDTEFGLAIYRTQLFNPADIDNVKQVQAGYKVQPLSQFLGQPAPVAAPDPKWPPFSESAFKTDVFFYLTFLLQFCPTVPQEATLRQRFAEIDVAPGRRFDFEKLPLEDKAAVGFGIRDGFEKIKDRRANLGTEVNGWRITKGPGDRAAYRGDWLTRAAVALAGIYANDPVEALYPIAYNDAKGDTLDASKHRYTITFPAGQYPPVNAFWSVTMYDGKTQLLIDNPIDRYLINSPMLPQLKKNRDGSLTIYVQKDSPGKGQESNWLPAPNGEFYMVMRLYWPKQAALDGEWQPTPVMRVD